MVVIFNEDLVSTGFLLQCGFGELGEQTSWNILVLPICILNAHLKISLPGHLELNVMQVSISWSRLLLSIISVVILLMQNVNEHTKLLVLNELTCLQKHCKYFYCSITVLLL